MVGAKAFFCTLIFFLLKFNVFTMRKVYNASDIIQADNFH